MASGYKNHIQHACPPQHSQGTQTSEQQTQPICWVKEFNQSQSLTFYEKENGTSGFLSELWVFQWILHPPVVAFSSSSTTKSPQVDMPRREPAATDRLWQREFMVRFYADDIAVMCLWWMAGASNNDPYESARQIYCNKQHFMETEHGDEGLRLLKACYQAELVKQEDRGYCP